MASSYMTFEPSGAGTSRRKGTISAWLKRGDVSSSQRFWGIRYGSGNTTEVTMNEYIQIYANSSSSEQINLRTTAKYQDPGAWYHVVVGFDTEQSVEADRVKLYVNGVQNSTFSTYTNYPALNDDLMLGQPNPTSVGAMGAEGSNMWNGCISWAQYVDGLQLAPTEFGEVDATSGIWKIKTTPYATPGINGFCLKMEDRTNLDLDSSSNAHTFTTVGTPTATYDSPSNNFATMNPLDNYYPGATFTNGNTKWSSTSSNHVWGTATMPPEAGLWYWEVKPSTTGTMRIGVADRVMYNSSQAIGTFQSSYGYMSSDGNVRYNATGSNEDDSYGDSYTSGDIIGVYMDLEAGKIYWAKNGTVQNSGTGITIDVANAQNGFYFPIIADTDGTCTVEFNFGNGYFGTTAVTSAVADAGGIGAFEYDPSAGTFDGSSKDFRALCTKNIKAYGG